MITDTGFVKSDADIYKRGRLSSALARRMPMASQPSPRRPLRSGLTRKCLIGNI
jgi:hypothetical protein